MSTLVLTKENFIRMIPKLFDIVKKVKKMKCTHISRYNSVSIFLLSTINNEKIGPDVIVFGF